MKKKAAIELSINFIIILILTIIVFGFGIWIANKFLFGAQEFSLTFDDRTKAEIEQLMDDGSRVAIPFERVEVRNGEYGTIGVGILNVADNLEDFQVNLSFSKAFDHDNTQICTGGVGACGDPDTWIVSAAGNGKTAMGADPKPGITFTDNIRKYESSKFVIGFKPIDGPPGIYVYNLQVCYNNGGTSAEDRCSTSLPDKYDSLQKLYVVIP